MMVVGAFFRCDGVLTSSFFAPKSLVTLKIVDRRCTKKITNNDVRKVGFFEGN